MLPDIDDSVSIHRLQATTEASANIVHLYRKRKCQGEQLGQLTAKHKCYAPVESLEKNSQASSSQTHLISQKIESTSPSDPESVKDSNSLPASSDSVTSSYAQTKSDPECSNAYVYDSCHSAADEYSNLEEDHLLEFEMHVTSECENGEMEPGEDHDLDDLLCSESLKVNPNMFVLSSGRWVIDQDAQSAARKPTIDQEFEQYFSTLML